MTVNFELIEAKVLALHIMFEALCFEFKNNGSRELNDTERLAVGLAAGVNISKPFGVKWDGERFLVAAPNGIS